MSELEDTDLDARDRADPPDGRSDRTGTSRALWVAFPVGLAALIPRLLTVGHFFNLDEWLWMHRSMRFSDALLGGHLEHMSATKPLVGTMPGIPTVWLGTLARGVWNIGVGIGLVDGGQEFVTSASGFATGQAMVAIATSVLIGLFTWLVAMWMSRRVALIAGLVLATEPFWVSLGSILHTDELVALFGISGMVALSWTLGLPRGVAAPAHPRRWGILAAVLLVLAPLTKISGLVFGVPALGMICWALLRDWRDRPPDVSAARTCGPVLRLTAWMVLASVITVVVTYPALIVDPATQWHALQEQLETVQVNREVFFMGELSPHPGAAFYPVSLAYHSSAWFFVLAPAGVVVALFRRASRPFAVTILLWAVVPTLSLFSSGLVYARYGLVALGPLALAAACAVQPATPIQRWWRDRINQGAVAAGVVVLFVAVLVAPWGGITFNPILSAYRKPILVVPVGWGEAVATALPVIERDARGRGRSCSSLRIKGLDRSPPTTGCRPAKTGDRSKADYVVVSGSSRQRAVQTYLDLGGDFDLIEVVYLRGQRIAEVWRRK